MQVDFDVAPSVTTLDALFRFHPANLSHIRTWVRFKIAKRISRPVGLRHLRLFAAHLVEANYSSTGDFLSSIVKYEIFESGLVQDVHFPQAYSALRRGVAEALDHLKPAKAPVITAAGLASLPRPLQSVAVFCAFTGLRTHSILGIRPLHLKSYRNRFELVVVKDKVKAARGRSIQIFCCCASFPTACPVHVPVTLPIDHSTLNLISTKLQCSGHSFRRTLISSIRYRAGDARFTALAPQIRKHFGWSTQSLMPFDYTSDLQSSGLNSPDRLQVPELLEFFRLQSRGVITRTKHMSFQITTSITSIIS